MDSQQQYKSSEKTSELIEKEIKKRQVKYPISQLENLLYEIAINAKNKANINQFGIKGYSSVINLDCNKNVYGDMSCEYNIKISISNLHKENDVIECYSDSKLSPYKIQCTHYSSKSSFELSDSLQNSHLIEGIKYSVQNILNILNPEVLTHMDKQNMHITTFVSKYSSKQIQDNPEISKNNNEFTYSNNGSNVKMNWLSYVSKL